MATDLLLIDDSPTDLRLLIDMAAPLKLRVSVAFDGWKGVELAKLQKPALILLDVQMPGMDGYAACRLLKSHPSTAAIPVVFLTSANELNQRLTGFALGAVDYIGKPFHAAEVLARVGVHAPALRRIEALADARDQTDGSSAPGSTAEPRADALARAAKTILIDRIADPPALEELARLLGSNRRQLNEAFQACCGQATFGWLREERMRRAHRLISDTATPIALIGAHLGFPNPANFSRAFHDRFGFSPSDLRRELKEARARAFADHAPSAGDAPI